MNRSQTAFYFDDFDITISAGVMQCRRSVFIFCVDTRTVCKQRLQGWVGMIRHALGKRSAKDFSYALTVITAGFSVPNDA